MPRRPSAVHVCSRPGCPELTPCPTHSRPAGAPWSPDRDHAAQHRFRRAVLERDGHRCTMCGNRLELVAHHVRPGYDAADGVTLCKQHHREVDSNAR